MERCAKLAEAAHMEITCCCSLQVHNNAEWQEWVMAIREEKGLGDRDVYIQVQIPVPDALWQRLTCCSWGAAPRILLIRFVRAVSSSTLFR